MNPTINDGCSGPSKSVLGSVVLFFLDPRDSCNSTVRCDLAAQQGAAGCLIYNSVDSEGWFSIYSKTSLIGNENLVGGTTIPSGSISYSDGIILRAKLTVNPSAIYTFTNLPRAVPSVCESKSLPKKLMRNTDPRFAIFS